MNQDTNQHALLTPADVANQLNVSVKTVYRLIKNRKLTAIQFERTLRIAPNDLDSFLQSCRHN